MTSTGPRVPAVVVSPYAKPNAVTDVVHDHTSVLATIEAKWNLEALTYRDANAATLVDFLDTRRAAFANPPTLAGPSDLGASESTCSNETPKFTVHPNPPAGGRPPSARPKHKRRKHRKHRKHHRHRHHRHHKHRHHN
jgi:phospholipase C